MTTGGVCRVWWARAGDHRPQAEALLGPDEKVRRDRYAGEADRRRFTVSAALLRLAVARELDCAPREVPVLRHCPDCPVPHGRPRIAAGPAGASARALDVSVSYAGEVVVVAVGEGVTVGVDAEPGPDRGAPGTRLAAFERALRPEERAELGEVPEAVRPGLLVRWWTYKEAVLKATGDGLRVPPTEIGVSGRSGAARLTAYPGRPELLGPASALRSVDPPLGWPSRGLVASVAFLGRGGTGAVRVLAEDGSRLLVSDGGSGRGQGRG